MIGCTNDEVREMYDEIVADHEIMKRRRAMKNITRMDGVYRIDIVTLEIKRYEDAKELRMDGYNVSNVLYACRTPMSICCGYLWRAGVDLDTSNVRKSLEEVTPELFIPVYGVNKKTKEKTAFRTLLEAHRNGFDKSYVLGVIQGHKGSYKGCKWFEGAE